MKKRISHTAVDACLAGMMLVSVFLTFLLSLPILLTSSPEIPPLHLSGKEAYDSGITLVQLGRDIEAAEAFWIAILKSNELNPLEYDPRYALEQFMATYHRRKIPEYGLLRLGKQFKLQGLEKEAIEYLNTVINMNSKIVEPYLLLASMQSLEPNLRLKYIINALMIDPDGYHVSINSLLTLVSLILSFFLDKF